MTTYYVKTDGDNTKDGLSEANAWETITYALTQMIANDVLNIAAGAYAEDISITTEHITLTGAGSGLVTITKLNLRASYPDVSGLTVTTYLLGDIPTITHISLNDVIVEDGSTLTGLDSATINNCDFTGLVFPFNANAPAFTNCILRAAGANTLYICSSSTLNATFENTTILGDPGAYKAIRILRGTNIVFTDTTFEYPEKAIEVRSGATATFIQKNRKVFVGTVGTNTVTPTESTLIVADGTYDYRDFVITPDASITILETSLWETSGDQNKAWKVEAIGSRTITFRLTDMQASTRYHLLVDDVKVATELSDSSGVIEFEYTGSFSEKAFTTEKRPPILPPTTTIMTDISLAQYINSQLRKAVAAGNLTDYNAANRSANYGNWIYADRPMIAILLKNKNNFPRVSVESLSQATIEEMGMEDPNHLENTTLKIGVWSARDLICIVESTVNEPLTYDELITTYGLTNLPASVISEVTDGVTTFIKGTDYQLIDSDSDGFYDSIEWLGEDTPADGADFYMDYKRVAAGQELVRLIAQDINAYLRTWRGWSEKIIMGYQLISSNPVPYDEPAGVYRHEMVVQFSGINLGETV